MFSAGTVTHLQNVAVGRHSAGITRIPQSGQPASRAGTFNPNPAGTDLNDADIAIRDQGQGMGNAYGIPGSQGPAVNIIRAARAIRGSQPPAIVQIDRRVDPQAQITGQPGGRAIHNAQENIPGRELSGQTGPHLNYFDLPNRKAVRDPESLGREGKGASRLAGGQASGVGRLNSYASDVGPGSLNEGPAPTRIPRVWNDGLNAAAGMSQYGFTQQNYRAFFAHLWTGRVAQPTRGIRTISGVRHNDGPTASRIRIPAVFVPSAVG